MAHQRKRFTRPDAFIIERRQIGGGTTPDPWLRFELLFGEPREKCRTWRFEMQGMADGHAVFGLKEPVDQSIILEMRDSSQHLELVLGDAECNYRVRIERNKQCPRREVDRLGDRSPFRPAPRSCLRRG